MLEIGVLPSNDNHDDDEEDVEDADKDVVVLDAL